METMTRPLPAGVRPAEDGDSLAGTRRWAAVASQLKMLLAFDLVFLFVCTAVVGAVLEE